MKFSLFLEGRANMGIISPEGKIFNLPGASEMNMVEYLKVNHVVDRNTTFGKLLISGWVFYTLQNGIIDVRFKLGRDTLQLINQTFKTMEFDEIHFDDPYSRTWHFKKRDDFMKDGI